MAYPTKKHQALFKAILKLKNHREVAAFFRDLLTIKELDDFAKRWQIVNLLYQKKLSYEQVAKKCEVSTTTVTRVAHWLHRGLGGYSLVLKRFFKP